MIEHLDIVSILSYGDISASLDLVISVSSKSTMPEDAYDRPCVSE
jgi:hypothetical protein